MEDLFTNKACRNYVFCVFWNVLCVPLKVLISYACYSEYFGTFFQKLKDSERQRVDKLEKFENKTNVQLERQLVLASSWSRSLLTLQGKLKGTEWDPVNSHSVEFSEFLKLLNSNNVQFMEYSNFGQTVSGMNSILFGFYLFVLF